VAGLLLTAWAMYDKTGWTSNVSGGTIALTGFIQGAGLGFLFVPRTTVTFATLAPEQRADATGLYDLSCNVGSNVGISVATCWSGQPDQSLRHRKPCHRGEPRIRQQHRAHHAWNPLTASGRAALDQVINIQASIISDIDDFKLMMILSLAVIPLVLLLRRAATPTRSDHAVVME